MESGSRWRGCPRLLCSDPQQLPKTGRRRRPKRGKVRLVGNIVQRPKSRKASNNNDKDEKNNDGRRCHSLVGWAYGHQYNRGKKRQKPSSADSKKDETKPNQRNFHWSQGKGWLTYTSTNHFKKSIV